MEILRFLESFVAKIEAKATSCLLFLKGIGP